LSRWAGPLRPRRPVRPVRAAGDGRRAGRSGDPGRRRGRRRALAVGAAVRDRAASSAGPRPPGGQLVRRDV